MKSQTLEQYLKAAVENGQIDHALRAVFGKDGKVTFYIRPLIGNGETVDFVVRGNALVLNLTNDSDVHQGVDSLLATRAPILDQITDLCHAIEKCGASPELTDAVTKASALREPISQLVQQAIALGLDTGSMAVSTSDEPKTGEASASSYTYQRTDLDDAVSLIHGLAKLASGAASLGGLTGNSTDAMKDLGELIKSTCAEAQKKLKAS